MHTSRLAWHLRSLQKVDPGSILHSLRRQGLHTFSHEGKPVLVITKEHTMSTTVDTSYESMILTIDEAAAYLAIPKATLYTWRTRRVGFGPRAVKMGGCLRYRRADLDAWIVEHLEPAAGE